jgi:hypothetical protein
MAAIEKITFKNGHAGSKNGTKHTKKSAPRPFIIEGDSLEVGCVYGVDGTILRRSNTIAM